MTSPLNKIIRYIESSVPYIWLKTVETNYFYRQLNLTFKNKKTVMYYDPLNRDTLCAELKLDKNCGELTLLDTISKMQNTLFIIFDYQENLHKIPISRKLCAMRDLLAKNKTTVVFISAAGILPDMLIGTVHELTVNVATREMFALCLKNFLNEHNISTDTTVTDKLHIKHDFDFMVDSGLGLTINEYLDALLLELAKSNYTLEIGVDEILQAKKDKLNFIGGLKPLNSSTKFKDLCGLERLKVFCKGMIQSKQAKGVLLLGVPGSGKTAFANALGNETNRVALILDFSLLLQGGNGYDAEHMTQLALDTLDAMAPCVVLVDEIEKVLAGVSADTDDSKGKRQGALFLKWLNDHTSEVFVVATCNNVTQLPAEYLRAERWDALFYVDVPDEKLMEELIAFYRHYYNIPEDYEVPKMEKWTGAEIKALCRISNSLSIPLTEAIQYINPITKANPEKIQAIRNIGIRMCINANIEGPRRIKKMEDYEESY